MLKSYASYFVSYLLTNIKEKSRIKRIILFGSVAKDEAEKNSDVDIFIELNNKNKKIEKEINKILENFYKSREALLFKSKGIDNKINIISGKLSNWKDLKDSIESTGIILYGQFSSSEIGGKKQVIIFWDKIGINRGAFLNKVYGFNSGNKKYSGLIEKYSGKKLGKSCLIIPIEHRNDFLSLVKKYKVNAKIIEVYI